MTNHPETPAPTTCRVCRGEVYRTIGRVWVHRTHGHNHEAEVAADEAPTTPAVDEMTSPELARFTAGRVRYAAALPRPFGDHIASAGWEYERDGAVTR